MRAVGERSIVRSGQRTTIAAGAFNVASSRVQPSSFIAAAEPETRPPSGATPAIRIPAERATGSSSESKFIATSARASGLISPSSVVSTVERTAEISTRPSDVMGGKSDG